MRIEPAAIAAAVEKNWQAQLDWLTRLVSFPTLRGREGLCQDWLARDFAARGWSVDRYTLADVEIAHLPGFSPVMDTDYRHAIQVVAALRAPKPAGKSLILQGHVDVVPEGPLDMWRSPPFEARLSDGRLYGRGAGDMKAGVSAMVFALAALAEAGFAPASDVYVQTVTEEECTGNGALSTLARGYRADACLIPEPTAQRISRGTLGVMWFRLKLRGRPAHVSRSEQGTNAILSAFGLIEAIREFTKALNQRVKSHPWFGKIENPIKFNPGKIKGGDWASSTPAWCEVDCRIAVLPGTPLPSFRRELTETILAAAKRDGFLAGNPPEIIWNGFQADDYVLEPGSDVEKAVGAAHREITGSEPQEVLIPAVTDCRFYGRYYDIPSLAYGPSATDGHGFDEYVELHSLKQATIVIARFIGEWCGLRPIAE